MPHLAVTARSGKLSTVGYELALSRARDKLSAAAPALAYGNGHLVMASNERSNIRVLSSADGKSI